MNVDDILYARISSLIVLQCNIFLPVNYSYFCTCLVNCEDLVVSLSTASLYHKAVIQPGYMMTSDIAITVEEVAAGHHEDRYIGQTDNLEYVWKCSKCNEILAGRLLINNYQCLPYNSFKVIEGYAFFSLDIHFKSLVFDNMGGKRKYQEG